ncbi:MAG: prepilin-type N-terminal cleavage/methylation domain-containing protein [Fibrobacteria bacterium]|nr:prepilin-type N-terminal cleavage/methylation domain-containing protein [Fibrobacteria bacterium]
MNRRGLTLMELMVAMVLTGILAWLALGMFSGESANYRRTREKIKMQSDAREAMRILEEELRNSGYGNQIAGTSRIAQTISKCTETSLGANGEALQAVDRSTMSGGDEITVRYFELPSTGVLTSCGTGSASQFREITYRLNSGRLERRMRRDPADSTAPWIPFLENVVSFQIQYGMVVAVDDYPTGMTPSATGDAANWTTGIGTPLTVSGTSSEVRLTGWSTSTRTAHLSTPIDTTVAGEAYRVKFTATANDAFLSGTNGYDTTLAATGSGLRVTLLKTDGTDASEVGFLVPTIADVAQNYEIYLTATADTRSALRVAIRGKLRTGALSGTQKLTLSNFEVERANRAKYFRWLASPTSAEMSRVGAVRLFLLVNTPQNDGEAEPAHFTASQLGDTTIGDYTASGQAAKRSHILYERIIPVVNNVL